jgi:hypothetical protein
VGLKSLKSRNLTNGYPKKNKNNNNNNKVKSKPLELRSRVKILLNLNPHEPLYTVNQKKCGLVDISLVKSILPVVL